MSFYRGYTTTSKQFITGSYSHLVMRRDVERIAKQLFPRGFSDRERAVFEAGIALGVAAHAAAGLPITRGLVAKAVERALEKSLALQPYRKSVKIRINPRHGRKKHEYNYDTLIPEIMDVKVVINYRGVEVAARMRYVKELRYPLMYVERITEDRG